jgi:hypothetical protein
MKLWMFCNLRMLLPFKVTVRSFICVLKIQKQSWDWHSVSSDAISCCEDQLCIEALFFCLGLLWGCIIVWCGLDERGVHTSCCTWGWSSDEMVCSLAEDCRLFGGTCCPHPEYWSIMCCINKQDLQNKVAVLTVWRTTVWNVKIRRAGPAASACEFTNWSHVVQLNALLMCCIWNAV